MAQFRLARRAKADLVRILAASEAQWGRGARVRYAALIAVAMRQVADDPEAAVARSRPELAPGVRSFHLRHVRGADPRARVKRPVHVLFFRAVAPGLIEITRVLHERMEPRRHMGEASEN